jgi:hypothetical protein
MEYAARLPQLPTRRTMLAPVVALVVGAGAATGVYALVDNNDQVAPAAKVIVVESPAPGTADIPGKNESFTAAAISQSGGVELRGSKASATGTQASDAAAEQRSDPHGPAVSLRNP